MKNFVFSLHPSTLFVVEFGTKGKSCLVYGVEMKDNKIISSFADFPKIGIHRVYSTKYWNTHMNYFVCEKNVKKIKIR